LEHEESSNLNLDAKIENELVQIEESSGNGGNDGALAKSLEVPNADRDSIDKNEDHMEDAFRNRGWLMSQISRIIASRRIDHELML